MKGLIAALLLVGAVLPATAQDYDDWIRAVQTLGESMSFTCEMAPSHPKDASFVENATATRWLLPNYKFLNANESLGSATVSEDATNITITNIQKEDFGIYFCLMRTDTDELRMVKWGLNMKGPYFEDLWEKYRMNTIIGLSAFFGFLVLAIGVILVYRFRWREPVSDLPASDAAEVAMPTTSKMAPEVMSSKSEMTDLKPNAPAVVGIDNLRATKPGVLPPIQHPPADKGGYDNFAAVQDDGSKLNTTAL